MDIYDRAAELLVAGCPFTVLTGAGISVESGLPPFRGPGGIWEKYEPEIYGHHDTFVSAPEKAWVLFHEMIRASVNAVPNEAHKAILRLQERSLAGPVITQNVDGLHRKAGSKDVLDVHGDISILVCPSCGNRQFLDEIDLPVDPMCRCGSYLRPDIVLYGETLPQEKIERAWELSLSGRPMLVIGTSGVVMPVAQLPFNAHLNGSDLILLDPYPSEINSSIMNVVIQEKAAAGMLKLERAIMKLK